MFYEIHHYKNSCNAALVTIRCTNKIGVLRQSLSHHDLSDCHAVIMPTRYQSINLAQCGDWESMLLFIEFQLLQCDDIARLLVSRSKHNTVRAFFDLIYF